LTTPDVPAPPERAPWAALRRFEEAVLVGSLALATLLPLVDVLGRATSGFHVRGGAALLQQLVLWLAFVGGLVATRERKHLTLSTVALFEHTRLERVARLLAGCVAATVSVVLAYASAQLVQVNREQGKTLVLGIPEWASECIMPVALGLMALRFAWQASERWWERLIPLAVAGSVVALGTWSPERLQSGSTVLVVAVLAAAACGAPIFALMGGLALLFFFGDGTPVSAVVAEVYRLISSPQLPALPLLTVCGYVLAASGASERLLRFFRALFGWMPGGLAVIVTGVCALFTTFTGGSGVTIIAVGGLVYPMLRKDGYPEGFSIGLVTAAGSLGLLFPPSLPVILYSVVASNAEMDVPAGNLYLGGLLPGLFMIALVASYGVWVGRKLTSARQSFSLGELGRATWAAKWELGLPVFVIGLFASGQASMIETAAAALLYAVITQCLITRDVHPVRELPKAVLEGGVLMGAVLLLLAVAMGLTAYLVDAQIADALLTAVKERIHSPAVFLLALNGLLLIVGCLVDIFSAIVVVVPLIAPLGAAFGVDPLHLGIIFLTNLELGFLTPPVGMNLFLASSRFDRPLLKVCRDALPFLAILALGVLLITYLPDMSLGLLKALGKYQAPAGPSPLDVP
jgi:C4-dicarboxylate transporter, DctM subunit